MAIVAIIAAVGLLGLVVVEIVNIPQQQAKAKGCESGPGIGRTFNAS